MFYELDKTKKKKYTHIHAYFYYAKKAHKATL